MSCARLFFFLSLGEMERGDFMLSPEKLARINELAKKKKTVGLTLEEAKEQTSLRKEYLETFRSNMKKTIENVTVIDPEGNDITPDKVKRLRSNKFPN